MDGVMMLFYAGGGVLAAATVVRDARVSLKGRACAAGCLKLYMARTPQELIAAGVGTNTAATAGAVPLPALGTAPLGAAQGAGVLNPASAVVDAAGPPSASEGNMQPALVPFPTLGVPLALGSSTAGLSATPAAAPQKKPKPPVTKGGSKKRPLVDPVSFALGWFADSGEDNGEERLWLEEQMLVADGVKEKVCFLLGSLELKHADRLRIDCLSHKMLALSRQSCVFSYIIDRSRINHLIACLHGYSMQKSACSRTTPAYLVLTVTLPEWLRG